MNSIKSVCIYCASSTQIDESYFHAAKQLGTLLANKGIHMINGAGSIGLMRTVSDAALEAGGQVTGVIPSFMVEQGWHHKNLSKLHITATMHERKQLMADLSEGIIALPGGCGTMEELLEAITWKQLGLYLQPFVRDASTGCRTTIHASTAHGHLANSLNSRRGRKPIVDNSPMG